MATKKELLFINKLLEKTKDGSISWKRTEKADVFQVSFPEYSIRLLWRRPYEEIEYGIMIFNSEGNIISELWDEDFTELCSNPSSYKLFEELYELARNEAMGVDSALNYLLNELDDGVPF